ncbi:hypothetical protein [Neorhodopirellula lusitana]|uniref:hypothetical protein n=1 Tax=Neorhodopirellula lusitana TaxID=445327 RepID=UPI0024B8060D|nr:hypothetical protein [Neorhodopirellula lusitana]
MERLRQPFPLEQLRNHKLVLELRSHKQELVQLRNRKLVLGLRSHKQELVRSKELELVRNKLVRSMS